ncbi:cupin domain-containing protein [Thermodesulfobacteriota bacterium]
MKIVSLDQIEKQAVAMEGAKNLWKQVPVSADDGSPLFCFRVFSVEPDGHTPYHIHPFEHLNYVIEGRGALVNTSGEERELKKGDFALVLPDEKHQYRNKSDREPFVMICAVPKEYE